MVSHFEVSALLSLEKSNGGGRLVAARPDPEHAQVSAKRRGEALI